MIACGHLRLTWCFLLLYFVSAPMPQIDAVEDPCVHARSRRIPGAGFVEQLHLSSLVCSGTCCTSLHDSEDSHAAV